MENRNKKYPKATRTLLQYFINAGESIEAIASFFDFSPGVTRWLLRQNKINVPLDKLHIKGYRSVASASTKKRIARLKILTATPVAVEPPKIKKDKLFISKEQLVNLYVNENKSVNDIAIIYNSTPYLITKLLDQHEIQRTTRSFPVIVKPKIKKDKTPILIVSKSELDRLYTTEGKSVKEIAVILNSTPYKIEKLLKFYFIQMHGRGGVCGNGPSVKPAKGMLYDLYVKGGQSTREIGKLYGVSYQTVCNWLRTYNIPLILGARKSVVPKVNPEKRVKGENYPSKEDLEYLYLNEMKSLSYISNWYNSNPNQVLRWLRFYNIPTRSVKDGARVFHEQC